MPYITSKRKKNGGILRYHYFLLRCKRPINSCYLTLKKYINFTSKELKPPYLWTQVLSKLTHSAPPGNAEILMTPQSINAVASNTCCRHHCVQLYPRDKIAVVKSRMYNKTTELFKSHMKLDVHRQFHKDILGRNVVTLEGVDVCPYARMRIIGVSRPLSSAMPSSLRLDLQLNTMATPVCVSLGIIL